MNESVAVRARLIHNNFVNIIIYIRACASPSRMATCHDPEGWRIISRIRDFDTSLCFEEGVLLSGLLAALLVVATAKSLTLAPDLSKERTRNSWYLLCTKLVRFCSVKSYSFSLFPGIALRVTHR